MYRFSQRSKDNLNTCHQDLVKIAYRLISMYDFSVICGARTLEEQQELYKEGKTTLDGTTKKSKHQVSEHQPKSIAMDIMPYKRGTNAFSGNEKDNYRFYYMMGLVKGIAKELKDKGEISHDVRFGLDWDGDDIYSDQNFDDMPHVELV